MKQRNWQAGLILFLSMFAVSALGQRGHTSDVSAEAFTSPTSGFPGYFDSNVAKKGSLVVEWPPLVLPFLPLPSIAVDYGLTDSFTVGTNALVTTIPWLFRGKGISLKARSLLIGNSEMQSAVTLYGAYLSADSVSGSWQMLTSNTSWKLASDHIVTAQLMALNLGAEIGNTRSIDYSTLRFTTAALGAGYQYIWYEHIGVSIFALVPLYTSVESDSVGANINMNLDARSGSLAWGYARATLDVNRDDWLYSFGGAYLYGVSNGILPWVSATKRW